MSQDSETTVSGDQRSSTSGEHDVSTKRQSEDANRAGQAGRGKQDLDVSSGRRGEAGQGQSQGAEPFKQDGQDGRRGRDAHGGEDVDRERHPEEQVIKHSEVKKGERQNTDMSERV